MFSYGMTLYELLSFQPPFSDIDPLLRKEEILQRRRPPKEHHTILPFQELMSICWNHNPEDRPNMKQIIEFIDKSEFDKLRIEAPAKPVSCVCICRVLPKNEEVPLQASDTPNVDKCSSLNCDSSSGIRRNVLVESFDSVHVGVLNFGTEKCSTIPDMIKTRGGSMCADATPYTRDLNGVCHASTQIWMYSYVKGQGFLQIFVWYDGTTEHYVSFNTLSFEGSNFVIKIIFLWKLNSFHKCALCQAVPHLT